MLDSLRVLLATLAACAVIAAACGSDSDGANPTATPVPEPPAITVADNGPLTIGVSAALSGTQINVGTDIADAVELAVAEAGGAVKGHPLQVLRMDDACTDAERARDVADDFIAQPSLVAIIGPMCTTGAQAANGAYDAAGIIHISATATRVELSEAGERYFFRTVWRDDAQARLQATHARAAVNAASAFLIDDGDPYSKTLADAFASEFEDDGGTVVARERITRGATDFSSLASQIVAADPDIVVYEGFDPEGALVVADMREAGYAGAFMGPDALLSVRDFLVTAGAHAEGAIITGGATPDLQYLLRFGERYQRVPTTPFVLQARDAVGAVVRALDSMATVDGTTLIIDRSDFAEALRTQTFAGLTGSITFDDRGDRNGTTASEVGLTIYRVVNGTFQPIP
jgi:branched-chain amino acid transport system substrate-binding protein